MSYRLISNSKPRMTDKDIYLNRADLHKQLPLFYQPWWLDAVSNDWDMKWLIDEKGAYCGVWVWSSKTFLYHKLYRNPLLTPYLGYYFFSGLSTEKMEIIIKQQMPKASELVFSTAPLQIHDLLQQLKVTQIVQRKSYLIDLSLPVDQLFQQIDPKRRGKIRKGERELYVKEGLPPISLVEKWHRKAFETKGDFYPYTPNFLEKVTTIAEAQKSACAFTAFDKLTNEPVACIWTVYDDTCLYNLLTALSFEKPHTAAISLLLWQAILAAKNKGLSYFDFEGSVDPGIETLFKSFGGKAYPYNYYIIRNAPLLKWYRRLRSGNK